VHADLAASCIATSVRLNHEDPAERAAQVETLRRYIALAAEVGATNIRTFSDPVPEDDAQARAAVLQWEAEAYAGVNDWAAQHGVYMLVETHTNMRAHWAREILDRAACSHLAVLWHIGHHIRRGQSVDEAYPHIRGYVRHLHFSAMPGREVTDADNQRTFELLAADGFDGFFSVEVINPDDPVSVLQLHIEKFKQFMAAIA